MFGDEPRGRDSAGADADDRLDFGRSRRPWLIALWLIGICALLAIAVAKIHPTDYFGLSEDDSIYFSSAKALAAGHGYVLESVPGTPPATKYPVLYPWMLSWIWRWAPTFPANLGVGIGLNVVFGFVYIVAAFFLLRGLAGLGDWERVLLVAYCGLHPILIFHAGSLLSDLPFAAAVMSAMALSVHAFRREESDWLVLCAGFLAGAAMLLRTLGLPVLVGLALAIVIQKRWRNLAFFVDWHGSGLGRVAVGEEGSESDAGGGRVAVFGRLADELAVLHELCGILEGGPDSEPPSVAIGEAELDFAVFAAGELSR